MKILVTGATGFTGLIFKSAAEAEGHQVFSLTTNLTNKDIVVEEVRQIMPDQVVHLAGISFVSHADDAAFYGVNVVGTMNLLSALAALPVKPLKILLASSANIYGNCDSSPISENQPAAPVNHYGMSKLAMEYMAWTYLEQLPIIVARPFNYTGPGQAPQFLIPKLISHFAGRLTSVELGNLHVEREFNDVRMVCDSYLALLSKGIAGQAYNICSGRPYTLSYVIDVLSKLTGHTIEIQVNPAYVRSNEVHRLCGSPNKLISCIGPTAEYKLENTLQWMLDATT